MTAFYSASDQPTPVASPGAVMGVDWEQRVDFGRLRSDRIAKVQAALDRSELGALILFDMNNIRYTTATHIGNWARDKFFRCALVMRGQRADPVGHRLVGPHPPAVRPLVPARTAGRRASPAGVALFPTYVGVEAGNAARLAGLLRDAGLADGPVGVDVVELPVLRALEREGLRVEDGHGLMQDVRAIKTADEIALLDHAAALVDGAYEELYRLPAAGHPGERLRGAGQPVSLRERLGGGGGGQLDLRRAVQPAPARVLRPADPARGHRLLRHHPRVQRLPDLLLPDAQRGQRRCRAQREAYRRAREFMDNAIARDPARRDLGRRGPAFPGRPRSSGSPARRRRSACSTATASGCPTGNGR